MTPKKFSLAIPFYNEQAGIDRIVPELLGALQGEGMPFELVLVDNGSNDKTPQMLEALARKHAEISVVHVDVNQGYGWGMISGLRAAKGDWVGFLCGDGQSVPSDVAAVMRRAMKGDADLVKSRRIQRDDNLSRRVNSWFYNRLFRVMFGVMSPDVNGSPKIFSRETLGVLNPQSKDWFIDAEIMIKAKRRGMRLAEVPAHYRARLEGKSHVSLKAVWEFILNMLCFRFNPRYRS